MFLTSISFSGINVKFDSLTRAMSSLSHERIMTVSSPSVCTIHKDPTSLRGVFSNHREGVEGYFPVCLNVHVWGDGSGGGVFGLYLNTRRNVTVILTRIPMMTESMKERIVVIIRTCDNDIFKFMAKYFNHNDISENKDC